MSHNPIPIILSGTSCAGKSTVAKELEKLGNYSVVKAVTTRSHRKDDFNYDYWKPKDFNKLDDNKLLVSATYSGERYGILKSEYEKVDPNKHPILIITAESADTLISQKEFEAIWFFLDAEDDLLEERYKARGGYDKTKLKAKKKQNAQDREYAPKATYVLKSKEGNLGSITKLIVALVDSFRIGGGLSKNIISLMIDCGMLLDNADPKGIKGASYDLLLGDEYYYDGKIKRLTDASSFLTIEPYDYAIVSCKERARIPRDVIGKFGLTVGLFCQGIILSNGPQIDPGFNGTLFCLLFNTSNQAVHLKRGMHYATIEFNKLIEPAPPYKGSYQDKTKIIDYIPANALHGAINELKKEIEQLKKESKLMQNIYLAVVGIMFAILSILLVLR